MKADEFSKDILLTLTAPKLLVNLVFRRFWCPVVSLLKLPIMLLNLSLLALSIPTTRFAPALDLRGTFAVVLTSTVAYRASSWAGSGLLGIF
jgi:hypothetical protein